MLLEEWFMIALIAPLVLPVIAVTAFILLQVLKKPGKITSRRDRQVSGMTQDFLV